MTIENEFFTKEKEFDEKMQNIVDVLNSCGDHYDDAYKSEGVLKTYKEYLVYDQLDMLKRVSDISPELLESINDIQKKIREAYLLTKDLLEGIRMYK